MPVKLRDMPDSVWIFAAGLVVGLVLGALLAWLAVRSRQSTGAVELARAISERDAACGRAEALSADRQTMADRFAALSSEALQRQDAAVNAADQRRAQQTEYLLDPVKQALTALNERLLDVERGRQALSTQVSEQVDAMRLSNEELRRQTHALSTALRQPHVRGSWGEAQLKRLVEVAGMVEHCDFDVQVSASRDERQYRPDMKVYLADHRVVFVDAKTPLGNYLSAQEADDDESRTTYLKAFAANVRGHIDALAAKEYWRLDDESAEFVVLFLPSDAYLQTALQCEPDLYEHASAAGVMLATPSLFMPLLRIIQQGWRQQVIASNTAEVVRLGKELYERLSVMGRHFEALGGAITKTVKTYNETLGSIDGRVMPTARKFESLLVLDENLPRPSMVEHSPRPLTTVEFLEPTPTAEQHSATG